MEAALEVLRAYPSFKPVPREDLLALGATRLERARGERFFQQDDPADAVYGIVSGRIRVVKQSPNGREVCLELLSVGELVAALAVLRNIPLPASGIAAEPTAVLRIPAERFRWLIQRHPWLSTRILDVVTQRLLDASESRLSLATEPVETRLAQTLLRLADKYAEERGEQLVFATSLTRQQLADLAGTTVETTIRILSKWTRMGMITSCSSRITVNDGCALRRAAGRCPIEAAPARAI